MSEILSEINWIDIFYMILLVGMVYKGAKTGVSGQLFSLVGWVFILFISLEYYSFLSEAIFGFMLQRWSKPVSFCLISVIIFTVVKILERAFNLISSEDASSIERMGGILMASLRAFILFGLIGILFLLTPVDFLRGAALEESKTCMFFVHMDVAIYRGIKELIGLTSSDEKNSGADEGNSPQRDEIIKKFMVIPTV